MLRLSAVIITTVTAVLVPAKMSGDQSRSWSRILTDANSLASSPGVAFAIAAIEYENYTLSASCFYRYTVGSDRTVLHGQKRPDGTFRPVVTYEVATEGTTKWKQIHADIDQPNAETIIVSPDNPIAKLFVNMEPFQKTVGVFRYGRLVLENGDAAVFAIEDLLPTADARTNTSGFKEVVFQDSEEKKKDGFPDAWLAAPCELFAVVSFGERLIGDFIFEAPSGNPVTIQGTRTLDGDFWPKVTFQAANSDHTWKTIGESHHTGVATALRVASGKGERIRVVLSDYVPLIGKFKYGRIVFSNGQAGVFTIDLLNPK